MPSALYCPSHVRVIVAAITLVAHGPAQAAIDFAKDVKPLLENYCFKCHSGTKKKGDLSLDVFNSAASAAKDPKTWEAVLENIRTSTMPPDDEDKQPKIEERELLMKWIESAVFSSDPDKPDPGRVTIRRLNRAEYNNTIRDLVGVNFEPADDFPADDSGYGFDNIGDVLTVPPVLFERYLGAAEKVMSTAILNDHKPRPEIVRVPLLRMAGGPDKGNTDSARRIDERESQVKIDLPVAGEYTVRFEAAAPKVGPDVTRMEMKMDGQAITVPSLSAMGGGPARLSVKISVTTPGSHTLALRLVNPLAQPEMVKGKPVKRSITLRKVEFISPPQPVKAPETQIRLFAPGRGQPSLDAAARSILSSFAGRAFRRPLAAQEIERFMFIYKTAGQKRANFEQSVQTALTAVLVSPHFLFRGEFQPEPDNPRTAHPVNEWALASRLSYFLWSTMPDAELFAQAQAGTLRKNLDAQVRRMLKDGKSRALIENFAGQWLQIRNLSQVQPNPKTFSEWSPELANAMAKETEMLFEHIMREDRPVTELLGADYTFVNERLAKLYDINGVEGDAFVKVKLPAQRPGGILGHGSFLTLTSNPTRTSPVKRGKYVLENLLGTPPPPPPPNVPDLNDAKGAELKGTLRQRMEQHRQDAICASCHARMDPIGFGLENFDGIGAWRDKDGANPIDSGGVLVSGEKFKGPAELQRVLLGRKRGDFLRCVSEKMLTYALGRGTEFYDRTAIQSVVASLEKNDTKFSALVLGIVNSVPFQMRRGEGDHRLFADAAPAGKPAVKTEQKPKTPPKKTAK